MQKTRSSWSLSAHISHKVAGNQGKKCLTHNRTFHEIFIYLSFSWNDPIFFPTVIYIRIPKSGLHIRSVSCNKGSYKVHSQSGLCQPSLPTVAIEASPAVPTRSDFHAIPTPCRIPFTVWFIAILLQQLKPGPQGQDSLLVSDIPEAGKDVGFHYTCLPAHIKS